MTILHYRLDELLPRRRKTLTLLALLIPASWNITKRYSRSERLRLALIALGPLFIKFGQILSTRRDILPDDIAIELAKLQDQVPPFPTEQALELLTRAYGKPVTQVFNHFSNEPLASASVSQVYTAQLLTGEDVVIKLIRPNIEKVIVQDIRLLNFIATLIQYMMKDGKRFRPKEVVAEIEKTIFSELDMLCEGANAAQLRNNCKDSKLIYVPKIYFEYTKKNVLVMERIYGTRISDISALQANGVNVEKLARHGVEIFMTQVFRDRFFHADMHPGNVLVDHTDPENPVYCAVDFGIMGSLSEQDQYYLAQNFLAFFHRDYEKIAKLHVDSSWVSSKINLQDFTAAIRTVCEPLIEKPISEVSFGQLLLRLFQTARQFNMQVQPQLILLQKTLLNIEGLGRDLYPQLDLFSTVYPFLKNWAKERYSLNAISREFRQFLPAWLELFKKLPMLIEDTIKNERVFAQQTNDVRRLRKKLFLLSIGVVALFVLTLFLLFGI